MKKPSKVSTRNMAHALCAGGLAFACGLTAPAWACGGGAPAPESGTPMERAPHSTNLRVLIQWSGGLSDPASIVVAPSMQNVQGGFAWVVPVPSSVTPDDLFLMDTGVLDALDTWTGPREITRDCPYAEGEVVDACPEESDGGSGGGGGSTSSDGVSVTTTQLGAYTLHFLASEGADALLNWLDAEGLALPDAAASHVSDYLARSYSFVAIRVPADVDVPDGTELPALGFQLADGLTTLPMLMSAAVAQTEQNVTLFTIAEALGAIGVSNVTQVEPEYYACMLPDGDMGAAYNEDLSLRHAEASAAVWQQDFYYGEHPDWDAEGPTTTVHLDRNAWDAVETAFGGLPSHISRLQLRYAPGQLPVDPAFYPLASPNYYERYFIAYDVDRTSDYPVCREGLTEEGSCPEPSWDERNCDDDDGQTGHGHPDESADPEPSTDGDATDRHGRTTPADNGTKPGCSAAGDRSGGAGWMLLLASMLGGAGRRRDGKPRASRLRLGQP